MNPTALGLIVIGGLVQVAGFLFAFLSSEAIDFTVLIAALSVGILMEIAGMILLARSSRR